MIGVENSITIEKEIREYIVPLSEEELFQLELNIAAEGCREPLIVWEKGAKVILIDGHNRYKICQKNNIPFKIKKMSFQDLDQAKIWILDNQMGRRNLNADQLSYYRGIKYISLKKKRGGFDNIKSKGQSKTSTTEKLSDQFNVSESTIKRDAKFSAGLNLIAQTNPKLKTKILMGEVKVNKADVQVITDAKYPDKLIIKNEADLFNKAKIIRAEILAKAEQTIVKIKQDTNETASNRTKSDPASAFLDKGDQLRKIKGMILSSINRAINNEDANAIKELKKLINQLDLILFDYQE